MQQRGVIVTAVVLALILAGALWYTLTRDNSAIEPTTPTPTPVTIEESPEPVTITETPTPIVPITTPIPTPETNAVAPTAPSGTTTNVVAIALLMMATGLWQGIRAARITR